MILELIRGVIILIRNPNFDAEEKKWFALLLGIPFQYRELFYHQIETAEIHRDYSDRCLILNLYPPTGSQRLPDLGTRVPINMIIQHIAKPALTKGKVLFQERYNLRSL